MGMVLVLNKMLDSWEIGIALALSGNKEDTLQRGYMFIK
jgi:hypothetical protein